MPLPFKNVRYRYKTVAPKKRVRLAYAGKKVVEVTRFRKRNGTWVRGTTRRIKRK